jgi:hypothetical protein
MAKSTFGVIRGGRNSGPPATQAEIAAFDFGPLHVDSIKADRLKAANVCSNAIHAALVISLEIAALGKDELVARVREHYEAFGPGLIQLAHAADDARRAQELIMAAETRLAVALAVVEPNEDSPDDSSRA